MMVVMKELVETFDGSEHHINIVGVIDKLSIFDLLENGIKVPQLYQDPSSETTGASRVACIKFNNMYQKGIWNKVDPRDAQIMALTQHRLQ